MTTQLKQYRRPTKRAKQIVAYAAQEEGIFVSDLCDRYNITQQAANAYLLRLLDRDLLQREDIRELTGGRRSYLYTAKGAI